MAITDPIAATYVSTTTFTVATDRTAEFVSGVRVLADCGADGTRMGTASGSTYASGTGLTTVTVVLDSGVLTSNLTGVHHGNDVPASLVNHGHTSAADGGLIEVERVLGYDALVLSMSGLHGYWPLNDVTSGGALAESSGNGAAGATNLTTNVNLHHKNIVPTGAGKALQLGASTSDRATFTIPDLSGGFTVSVWHRTNALAATSRQIFAIDSSYGTAQPFCILKTTDTATPPASFLGVYSDDATSGSGCPNPAASYSNQYLHHYVARFDGLQAELFLNGVSCGKGSSLAGETLANLTTLVLGTGYWSHAYVDPCPGLYNGLAVFTRAVSDNEVTQLYQAGVGGGIKGDVGPAAELASIAETQAGTLTTKAVTPAGLAASAKGLVSANTTIYVATTGDDIGGLGTAGAPYASIARALNSIANKLIASGVTVTIQCADGTYTISSTITINHPDANKIQILGNTSAETTVAISSIDTTAKTITVAGDYTGSILDGDIIGLTGSSTSGLNGAYVVSGVSYNGTNTVITCSAETIASSTVGGGRVVIKPCNRCVLTSPTTMNTFTMKNNILKIEGFVIQGNGNISSYGFYVDSMCQYMIGSNNIVKNFGIGLHARMSSAGYLLSCVFYGCITGVVATYASRVFNQNSSVTIYSNCTTAITASNGSFVRSVNTIVRNCTTPYSPALNTVGNSNSFISNS